MLPSLTSNPPKPSRLRRPWSRRGWTGRPCPCPAWPPARRPARCPLAAGVEVGLNGLGVGDARRHRTAANAGPQASTREAGTAKNAGAGAEDGLPLHHLLSPANEAVEAFGVVSCVLAAAAVGAGELARSPSAPGTSRGSPVPPRTAPWSRRSVPPKELRRGVGVGLLVGTDDRGRTQEAAHRGSRPALTEQRHGDERDHDEGGTARPRPSRAGAAARSAKPIQAGGSRRRSRQPAPGGGAGRAQTPPRAAPISATCWRSSPRSSPDR